MLELLELRTPVVGPVSLTVTRGECVGVAGPSGSGKSSLLRAIADLDPHDGTARLDGRDMTGFAPAQWRRRVQLLPADPEWWLPRVGDHFPDRPVEAARRLQLPDGVWDWPAERLSSGERQRLALLRMLAREPEVLLLDEPTANLDADNVAGAEALIREYRDRRRLCVLWVSHDRGQLTRVADRRFTLRDGRLAAEPEQACTSSR
ncbi:MAG TPA: ATP-binding cassette domain-containing protein [Gammaproteobacteria bacterium]|nr:ATP-binding cassette domain-containing protein [Gammaproteobacteria bacterium]